MVTPEGRAKLGAEGIVDAEVELAMALPGAAGWIEARAPVKGPATVHLLLPDGHGEVSAAAPIHTVLQLREIVIPGADRVLGLDVDLDGAVELRYALGGHSGQVRARVKAGMPLEPVLRLVRGEVERHVQVARMWLRQPRLDGPHDLALPLYVEARRGLRTQVEVTASLSINPATKTVELRSIRARGANALGEAASRLYLNRRVFRPLGHTVLFDPAAMLPSTVTIHALHFADATPATVGLVVDLTVGIEDREVRIGVGST